MIYIHSVLVLIFFFFYELAIVEYTERAVKQ